MHRRWAPRVDSEPEEGEIRVGVQEREFRLEKQRVCFEWEEWRSVIKVHEQEANLVSGFKGERECVCV
jgi:hypothetical protein